MVCPCCGGEMEADGLSCRCGARVVGPPLLEPENIVPKLGTAFVAITLTLLSIPAFIWKWLVIFNVIAIYFAWKAIKHHKADARRYGGYKTALTAFSLSCAILLGVSIYVGVGIPKYLHTRVEKQKAATRAQMYAMALALLEYKKKHGTYPRSLNEIQADKDNPIAFTDYWENKLEYQATTELAADSKGEGIPTTVTFNQYQLVSAGPDGKLGTFDDIVLRDDRLVIPTLADLDTEK